MTLFQQQCNQVATEGQKTRFKNMRMMLNRQYKLLSRKVIIWCLILTTCLYIGEQDWLS